MYMVQVGVINLQRPERANRDKNVTKSGGQNRGRGGKVNYQRVYSKPPDNNNPLVSDSNSKSQQQNADLA